MPGSPAPRGLPPARRGGAGGVEPPPGSAPPGRGAPCLSFPAPPPQVRAFVGALAPDGRDEADLVAFRLGALNPILDPWIYILLRALPRCPRPRPRAEPGARDTDTAPAPAAELRQ